MRLTAFFVVIAMFALSIRISLPGSALTLKISLDKRPAFSYRKVDGWTGATKLGGVGS